MNIRNRDLKRRIIEISWKYKLAHIGSCLTAVDIIQEIYEQKKTDEKFILSSGHAGLALYVVNEKYLGKNAELSFSHHGVHPDRCADCSLDCSTGSLGQGLSIAVGMALANPDKDVYCLISDGEAAEGIIWEAIRIVDERPVYNLKIFVNYNGYAAYKESNKWWIDKLSPWATIVETNSNQLPFLKGQDAHYYTMKEGDYKEAMEILK